MKQVAFALSMGAYVAFWSVPGFSQTQSTAAPKLPVTAASIDQMPTPDRLGSIVVARTEPLNSPNTVTIQMSPADRDVVTRAIDLITLEQKKDGLIFFAMATPKTAPTKVDTDDQIRELPSFYSKIMGLSPFRFPDKGDTLDAMVTLGGDSKHPDIPKLSMECSGTRTKDPAFSDIATIKIECKNVTYTYMQTVVVQPPTTVTKPPPPPQHKKPHRQHWRHHIHHAQPSGCPKPQI